MSYTILFLSGLIVGIIIAWINEDKRINRLTVENRQLKSDKETMKKLIERLKS